MFEGDGVWHRQGERFRLVGKPSRAGEKNVYIWDVRGSENENARLGLKK